MTRIQKRVSTLINMHILLHVQAVCRRDTRPGKGLFDVDDDDDDDGQ